MKAARSACLLAAWIPLCAAAEEPLLSVDAFEAIVEGRSYDTHYKFQRYGIVSFLPGRRTNWLDADICTTGTWRVEGDLICMYYEGITGEDGEIEPSCWTYEDRKTFLVAWHNGDRSTLPVTMTPTQDPVTCEGYAGA